MNPILEAVIRAKNASRSHYEAARLYSFGCRVAPEECWRAGINRLIACIHGLELACDRLMIAGALTEFFALVRIEDAKRKQADQIAWRNSR